VARTRSTLTDLAIRGLAPPERGQSEVFDAKIPGFGVRVSSRGTKSFVLLYRFGGRSARLTLGRYPTLPLAEARARAIDALRLVGRGTDPSKDEEDKKPPTKEGRRLFGAAVDEYIEKHARPKNKDWRTTESILNRTYAAWHDRELSSISREDVIAAVDQIVAQTSTATGYNRFVYLRHFFKWCADRAYLDASPMAKVAQPAKAKDRERVLSDDELRCILPAAAQMGYPYRHLTWLLLLTAQRKGEVAGMRWSELDLEKGEWAIPAGRNKSARAHLVPLSGSALEVIGSIPRTHDALVFPARGRETTISGFSRWKVRLDELSGIEDWRVHDLRRTAATGMARLKVPPHVIERVLNHARGTFSGVAGVYNRFQYIPEMREALELWAEHIGKLKDTEAHTAT